MRQEREPRLPFTPILNYCATDDGALAEILGVSTRSIVRRKKAGVRVREAERCADVLGVHPAQLWGPLYYAVCEVIDQGART